MRTSVPLRVGRSLERPETKREFNRRLFAEVAPRYDFITRALSLGRDGAWKRWLVSRLPEMTAPVCLDVACGTGDLTFRLAARYPEGQVTGIDLSPAMIEIARSRSPSARVRLRQGDLAALPFESASVDLVTGGYALRNAPDLNACLAGICRIVRPGGTAAFLDFSKPPGRVPWWLEYALLKLWGGFWGLLLHGNPDVYGYIAESLRTFPDRIELKRMLQVTGFEVIEERRYFFGMVATTICRRE